MMISLTRSKIRLELMSSVIIGCLCMFVYAKSLTGGFLFDDFHNLVANTSLTSIGTSHQRWLELALSSASGQLRRPISMLSFGLNVAWFGMSPFAFKLVNVAIHLANGGLIYAIGLRICGRLIPSGKSINIAIEPTKVALMAAAIWLLHPLNLSGVVYIVQRMNELSALFTLAGLLCYVDGRERSLRGETAMISAIFGLCLFGLLAVFSKENGALIFAYALVIESICFRFQATGRRQRIAIKGFFWLSVGLPFTLIAAYLALHPQLLPASYIGRDFTLYERVLSETRIVSDYLIWIFVPNPTWMGLYHDDIAASTGLLNPISTLFAITFLLALVFMAWKLRNISPGFTFAVAWFLIGHSMESTILPLELVFEHRNYLPMAGLLIGSLCALGSLLPMGWSPRPLGAVAVIILLGLATTTAIRAQSWSNPLTLALDDALHHPQSSRDQYEAGRALIVDGAQKDQREKAEQAALPYFVRSADLDKNNIYPASNLILIQASMGPVDELTLADLATRLRTTTSYVQANPFLDMLTSATQRPLSLTSKDIATLVEAALTNPHFPPYIRANILNNFGAYEFNVAHDSQNAISMTMAAAAEDPANPYFEINLAKIGLALGQRDMAEKHLVKAASLDKTGAYDGEVTSLRTTLSSSK